MEENPKNFKERSKLSFKFRNKLLKGSILGSKSSGNSKDNLLLQENFFMKIEHNKEKCLILLSFLYDSRGLFRKIKIFETHREI